MHAACTAPTLAFALLATAFGSPQTAAAQVIPTGTKVSVTTVDATTRSIIYYVDLRNDADSEQAFSMRMAPPSFATAGGRDEGQSIDGPRQLALQGPGTLGQLVQDPRFGVPCSDRDSAFHGYSTGTATVDILLPARAATTVAIRYATGRRAPWVDADFRLRVTVQPRLVGTYVMGHPFFGKTATKSGTVTLRTRGPLVGPRPAAHLIWDTVPRGAWRVDRTPPRVRKGALIPLNGRVLPATAGATVVIQTRRPGGALRPTLRLKTDTRGRFSGRWRASGNGITELWALFPTQRAPLRADSTSCPLRLRVR